MLKILHTSDWHIGKRIYRVDLADDHRLFFDWIVEVIVREHIDILLIAGDVFDLSNPSVESRAIYYDILVRLRNINCQVIIVGGNHDSAQVLDAPKELLKALNITVVGGMPNELEGMLMPLKNSKGEVEAVVAAVPYLREADLRMNREDETRSTRLESMRLNILKIYYSLAEKAALQYPKIPLIGMGHLYGIGASISDSERDLNIGNLDAINLETLTKNYSYMALGHIHKPQKLSSTIPALYSGSPIALSFSEHSDPKRVVLLEIEEQGIEIQNVEVPVFRKLVRLKGSFTEIEQKLLTWETPSASLPTLVEIEFHEQTKSPQRGIQIQELMDGWQHPDAMIIKHRLIYLDNDMDVDRWVDENAQIEELKPTDVFMKLLERKALSDNEKELLLEAFNELLMETHESISPEENDSNLN
ncbi:MAG: exonuclease subunit SbcD [Salinivirgaceae bacterium]|nr:exonuclease subunit SbcD [Salinivirgaceae bacterium]